MQLVDGYSAVLISTFPTMHVSLFIRERELQPPSMDLGGPIDTTTMLNTYFRTQAAKSLVSIGDITLQCQYDPGVYLQMGTHVADPTVSGSQRLRLGQNAQHVIRFPDASQLGFFGWFEKISPPSHKEGEFPLMEVKLCVSNRASFTGTFLTFAVIAGEEYGPVFVAGRFPGLVMR